MSKTFVLIHGTWHGGWAWKEVVACLSAKGHRAYAPTLAGHGAGETRSGVTHDDCVSSVVSCIRQAGLDNVVLVGHSFGGTVVQRVVEEISDRISRTVFLDALSPQSQRERFRDSASGVPEIIAAHAQRRPGPSKLG